MKQIFPLLSIALALLALTGFMAWADLGEKNKALVQERNLLKNQLIDSHLEQDRLWMQVEQDRLWMNP